MRRYIQPISFIVLFLCMSLIGHAYILYRFFADGLLFTGPNDGMEQMVPIQMFLYEKWSEGTFFYATDFGLGGDFFYRSIVLFFDKLHIYFNCRHHMAFIHYTSCRF